MTSAVRNGSKDHPGQMESDKPAVWRYLQTCSTKTFRSGESISTSFRINAWFGRHFTHSGSPPPPSPKIPVRGAFAVTVHRAPQGARVPPRGPTPGMKRFSGPRGSIPGFTSSKRVLELKPRPPIYSSLYHSGVSSSTILPSVKYTLSRGPAQPYICLSLIWF
jgi:hypothetical protein